MAFHVMDEAARCLGCKKPRCQEGCPVSTPIPDVIRLFRERRLDEAVAMIHSAVEITPEPPEELPLVWDIVE